MARPPPFRRFSHPDGRLWEIRLNGSTVELRITTDGELVARSRRFDAPVLGANDLDAVVSEQLSEGFVELTPPDWRRRLDELVTFWDADDPGFDADVLRTQFLAAGEPLAQEAIEKLSWWETGQPRDPVAARNWLREHLDTILPGLLLALRTPDAQVMLHVDALLGEKAHPEIVEALMSIVEHPTPQLGDVPEARPAHMPLGALLALGKPDAETAARLAAVLTHDDLRVRDVAAAVLAEFSDDPTLFAMLWKRRVKLKESDGSCFAMLRCAEVTRASDLRDFLLWMQKSPRFRAPGYAERIGNALARLKNR
ncbi:MAG: hypothetical protein QM817_36245 [Archangium sp.]